MLPTLVVDDEACIRYVIRQFLEANGHEVIEAADGIAALAALEEHVVELVITDQTMPRMGGLKLLRRIQQDYPRKKVLAISGSDQALEQAACEPNVVGTLRKPFDIEALADALRVAFGV